MTWPSRLPIWVNISNVIFCRTCDWTVARKGAGIDARQTPEPIRRRPTLLASPETLGKRTRQAAADWSFITCLERFLKFHGWNPIRAKYLETKKKLVAIFLGPSLCWVFSVNNHKMSQERGRAAKAFWQRRGLRAVPDSLIALSEHKVSNTSIGICNEIRLQKLSLDKAHPNMDCCHMKVGCRSLYNALSLWLFVCCTHRGRTWLPKVARSSGTRLLFCTVQAHAFDILQTHSLREGADGGSQSQQATAVSGCWPSTELSEYAAVDCMGNRCMASGDGRVGPLLRKLVKNLILSYTYIIIISLIYHLYWSFEGRASLLHKGTALRDVANAVSWKRCWAAEGSERRPCFSTGFVVLVLKSWVMLSANDQIRTSISCCAVVCCGLFWACVGLFSEQLQVLCSRGFGVKHQGGCPAAAQSRCNCR